MKSEHTKLIVIGVLLAVAVGVWFWYGRDAGPLEDRVTFVCVATGKVYELRRADVPSMLPATNPDTQEKTLIPAHEMDGKLYASERHAPFLLAKPEIAEVNKYVDPSTLEVLESPR